jgi:hypothetical protein
MGKIFMTGRMLFQYSTVISIRLYSAMPGMVFAFYLAGISNHAIPKMTRQKIKKGYHNENT